MENYYGETDGLHDVILSEVCLEDVAIVTANAVAETIAASEGYIGSDSDDIE